MDQWEKERLQQLRGMWGWGLAAAWIVYNWWQLEQIRNRALATGCPESFANSLGDAIFGKGQSCINSINGDFNSGLFASFLTAPIAFVIVHYYAKWRLRQIMADAEKAQREFAVKQELERKQAHEAAIGEMSVRAQIEQQATRQSGDRFEIITRLGAVDDQLVVLENEANAENIKLIKLNIGQSIRDIHAKFKEDELAVLYGSDDGLRQRVDRTLAEMARLGLADSRFHRELTALFGVGVDG